MNYFRVVFVFTIFLLIMGCKDDIEIKQVGIDYDSIFPAEPKWFNDKYERNEVEDLFGFDSELIYSLLSGLENSIHARMIANITEDTVINHSLINNLRSQAQSELNDLLSSGMSLKDIDILRFANYSEAQSTQINPYSQVSLKKFEILADYFKNYGSDITQERYNGEYYNLNIQVFYEKLVDQGVMMVVPENEWDLYSIDNLKYLGGISFKDIKENNFNISDVGKKYNDEVIISNIELVTKMDSMRDLKTNILTPLSPSIFQDELDLLLAQISDRNRPALLMESRLQRLIFESTLREFDSLLSSFKEEYLTNPEQDFSEIIESARAINERAKATIDTLKLL